MGLDGAVEAGSPDRWAWLDAPGWQAALQARVRSFLRSRARSDRWGGRRGVVHLERLDRAHAPWALVRLVPYERLPVPIYAGLSPRQLDVCRLASGGATTAEVATALDLGVETVRTHLKEVYRRLGVANRIELVCVLQRTWPTLESGSAAHRRSG